MSILSKVKKKVNSNDITSEILHIDIQKIKNDKQQIRKHFDQVSLNELAESIKVHGVLSPIIVRQNGDNYQIIAGERRYRASVIAGKENIPAIVKDVDNGNAKNLQLIENLQRDNITAIETAIAFKELTTNGMTQDDISRAIGISKGNVSKYVKISAIEELDKIADVNPQAGAKELYEIAKEHNTKKRNNLIRKLTGGTIATEEKEVEQDDDIDMDLCWKLLKKEVSKDVNILAKYVSSKKLKKLLEKNPS